MSHLRRRKALGLAHNLSIVCPIHFQDLKHCFSLISGMSYITSMQNYSDNLHSLLTSQHLSNPSAQTPLRIFQDAQFYILMSLYYARPQELCGNSAPRHLNPQQKEGQNRQKEGKWLRCWKRQRSQLGYLHQSPVYKVVWNCNQS